MPMRIMTLRSGRIVAIGSLDEPLEQSFGKPFVVLVPAFNALERCQVESMANALMNLGCKEFCCVGPQAEQLHDSLDEIVEEQGAIEVVTTWHANFDDAFEYFEFAAGEGTFTLLALVSPHSDLAAQMEAVVAK